MKYKIRKKKAAWSNNFIVVDSPTIQIGTHSLFKVNRVDGEMDSGRYSPTFFLNYRWVDIFVVMEQ